MSSDDQDLGLSAINNRFYEAFSTLDIEEMAKVWELSDRVRCIHPGWPSLSGWDTIRQSWETIFRNSTLMHFILTEVKSSAHGDCGWVDCVENITAVIDGKATSFSVQATNIFVRHNEGWHMVHHHGSAYS